MVRKKIRKLIPRIVQYLVLSAISIVVLIPIGAMAHSATIVRAPLYIRLIYRDVPEWSLNFMFFMNAPGFWTMLKNSVIVMAGTTAAALTVCSLAAFVFARMRFRTKDLLFNILTLGLMFPVTIAILPVFLVARQVKITDLLAGIVVVQTAFAISGNVMILRGFFLAVPLELEDAAYIDGCTPFDFFRRILLPMTRPALAAVAALVMIASWNDLLVPLVLINKESLWTLPLGTTLTMGAYGNDTPLVFAFVTLSMIPTLVFYFLAERQIVSGLTAGAVKQ